MAASMIPHTPALLLGLCGKFGVLRRALPCMSYRKLSSCIRTNRKKNFHHVTSSSNENIRQNSSLEPTNEICRLPSRPRSVRCHSSRPAAIGRRLVLGIETSCDDTGAAVVDDEGNIVGEALNSQTSLHVEMGGIIPPFARDLHEQNIDDVVSTALREAGVTLQDLDAIAATVKPGLAMSLDVGVRYAKRLVKESGKPFIPIHHMEAHALTARMIQRVEFPFLVLLVSGGHCLLAVVRALDDILLLGQSLDIAPGDAFDKAARRLKLKNLPEYAGMSGGGSLERAALHGDPHAFSLSPVMARFQDCSFSFSGILQKTKTIIEREEQKQGIQGGRLVGNYADVSAHFQYSVLHHLAKRLQRGLLFTELQQLLPANNKTLVVSGGVASNMFIREGLRKVCEQFNCELVCPPPHLCTDNGIMIAWNGMEKLVAGLGVAEDPEKVDIQPKCQFGEDITGRVRASSIKLKRIKIL